MNRQFSLPTSNGKLADRFQEWLALDVADGAADFGDDDIDIRIGELVDDALDLVGDMRDDLDGLTEKLAASFLVDNAQINLPVV